MSLLCPRRLLPLLVLLYITADFTDPAAPGVFFFDNDVFFVDSVVQLKSHTPRDLTPLEPMPIAGLAHSKCEILVARVRVVARPFVRPRRHWRAPKHDDSSSDSSVTPLSA
jgi:hypothetical protein